MLTRRRKRGDDVHRRNTTRAFTARTKPCFPPAIWRPLVVCSPPPVAVPYASIEQYCEQITLFSRGRANIPRVQNIPGAVRRRAEPNESRLTPRADSVFTYAVRRAHSAVVAATTRENGLTHTVGLRGTDVPRPGSPFTVRVTTAPSRLDRSRSLSIPSLF